MDIKTPRSAIGKVGMMAFLVAVTALWTFGAYAGLNENLIEASRRGDLREVKGLLAEGANVNAKDEFGMTALIRATGEGHREVVQILLDKEADVNAKDHYGFTALKNASHRGHREVVQALLDKGADVNAMYKGVRPP